MSIATMQRQLAASSLGEVELRIYFRDLCRSIDASMIGDHGRLSLTSTTDETMVPAEVSISLGLIVTELVINALKHAFPGHDPSGRIEVVYAARGTGWTLSVGDDGIGMPTGDNAGKPGLGTGIVEALSKQLGATVSIAAAEPGTTVSIVLG
jgi:two-component sensor histidine kinase